MKWIDHPWGCKVNDGWGRGRARAQLLNDDTTVAGVVFRDKVGYWCRGRAMSGSAPEVTPVFFGPYDTLDAAKAAAVFLHRIGELK